MKHVIEKYDEKIWSGSLWNFYFEDMKVGVLDIETTGLNPSRNKFILGCLYMAEEKKLHQVLAECRAEENAALAEYLDLISDVDMVVTYNGKHFDIPFIQKRAGLVEHPAMMPYNLDLYLVLKGHSPIRKLVPNLKQKTVENYMGLWSTRTDEISGAESVDLYNHYEATGDSEAETKILLHNNDDVRQLTRLIKVIAKSDFHKAMYNLGFPVKAKERVFIIQKLKMDREFLLVSGIQKLGKTDKGRPIDYMGFGLGSFPVQTRMSSKSAEFEFRIPVIRQSGLTAIDLQAAGLDLRSFEKYPSFACGFLAVEDSGGLKYMEINHFARDFIKMFIGSEIE